MFSSSILTQSLQSLLQLLNHEISACVKMLLWASCTPTDCPHSLPLCLWLLNLWGYLCWEKSPPFPHGFQFKKLVRSSNYEKWSLWAIKQRESLWQDTVSNCKSEILSTHTLALKFPGTCGERSYIVQWQKNFICNMLSLASEGGMSKHSFCDCFMGYHSDYVLFRF